MTQTNVRSALEDVVTWPQTWRALSVIFLVVSCWVAVYYQQPRYIGWAGGLLALCGLPLMNRALLRESSGGSAEVEKAQRAADLQASREGYIITGIGILVATFGTDFAEVLAAWWN